MSKRKTRVAVPRGKGTGWWKTLSAEQKKALVYPRLARGASNPQLSAEFGVTPNSIASLRNKWNLTGKPDTYAALAPDDNEPAQTPVSAPRVSQELGSATTQPVGVARVPALRYAKRVLPNRTRGLLADPPNLPKLTNDVVVMCTHVDPVTKKRCPYMYEDEKTRRCRVHATR